MKPTTSATPRATRRVAWGTIALLLPSMLPVAVFSLYPLLHGLALSFTDVKAGRTDSFSITFDNFVYLLGDRYFWESFRIGGIWAVSVTTIQFVLALGLALLLNRTFPGRTLIRALVIVPWAMPPVVAAFAWMLVYHPNAGALNALLKDLGLLGQNVSWLGDPATALMAVIVVGVWSGLPQTTVILLAGLQAVPHELHEAAALDGAGVFERFKTVTWPALLPVVFAITTLDFVWNFNSFGLVYVLTEGGPAGSTRLPMLFAYEEAFKYGNYAYASSLGLAMVVVIAVPLVFYVRRQMRSQEQ